MNFAARRNLRAKKRNLSVMLKNFKLITIWKARVNHARRNDEVRKAREVLTPGNTTMCSGRFVSCLGLESSATKNFSSKFLSCPQLATSSSELVPAPLFDSQRKAITWLYFPSTKITS